VVGGALAQVVVPAETGRAGVRLPPAADPAPPLPAGAELDLPGLTPHVTQNGDFYKIDISLRSPHLAVSAWRLPITGLVDEPRELRFEDLLAMPLVERRVTLACVSNPVGGEYVGNATWLGVPVRHVLEQVGVSPDADAVKSSGADGITIGTPLAALTDGRDAMLAVGMNGEPLPIDHGFPVRMVVPGLFGYVSATKWLTGFEVTRFVDFDAYWTPRGWSELGPVKTGTRIDLPDGEVEAGAQSIAGVAWHQHLGIVRVEVQVDGGAWQEAELATEDSVDTWRQWRLEWDAEPGEHLIVARATDGAGQVQTAVRGEPAPDGATGWPSVTVDVR
jgi:DMSO/TMAO reductase YedYZ molybdopterin-dependent catalytic subunit